MYRVFRSVWCDSRHSGCGQRSGYSHRRPSGGWQQLSASGAERGLFECWECCDCFDIALLSELCIAVSACLQHAQCCIAYTPLYSTDAMSTRVTRTMRTAIQNSMTMTNVQAVVTPVVYLNTHCLFVDRPLTGVASFRFSFRFSALATPLALLNLSSPLRFFGVLSTVCE